MYQVRRIVRRGLFSLRNEVGIRLVSLHCRYHCSARVVFCVLSYSQCSKCILLRRLYIDCHKPNRTQPSTPNRAHCACFGDSQSIVTPGIRPYARCHYHAGLSCGRVTDAPAGCPRLPCCPSCPRLPEAARRTTLLPRTRAYYGRVGACAQLTPTGV